MVALCSKTYSLVMIDNRVKFSSKGLNKRALNDPHSVFRRVLETGRAEGGVNRGFRAHQGTICTYEQYRNSIAYFYCKRRVLSCGIRTEPLRITLRPWGKRKVDLVGYEFHPLWPDTIHNFSIHG